MLQRKIDNAKIRQAELTEQDESFETRSQELEQSIDQAEKDEEMRAVEEEIEKLSAEKEKHEENKQDIEEEIEKLENELKDLNEKAPKNKEKGDKRNMPEKLEVREGIKNYVQSKGEYRDGFTSVEGGALIPEELLAPQKAPEDTVDLATLVNVAKVNSGSGKYPVVKKSGSKMNSVEELEKNPELAKPEIDNVNYDIETYRGYIPVSQEVIDDADYDVVGLIADEITDQELNTRNEAIAEVLKDAPAEDAEGIDGLKEIFNVKLKRAYNGKAIISSSLYNELDTTKDGNGRYLLQDDITVSSGKKLFGNEVVVLDDDVIGEKDGDLVGFIGDPKEFATFFDRKRTSVKWIDNDIYGQLLAGFVRFDVKEVDEDAGFYVTYTSEGSVEG